MGDKEEINIQSKEKNNMNKVIIVTGGSRGIGASTVKLLAKAKEQADFLRKEYGIGI